MRFAEYFKMYGLLIFAVCSGLLQERFVELVSVSMFAGVILLVNHFVIEGMYIRRYARAFVCVYVLVSLFTISRVHGLMLITSLLIKYALIYGFSCLLAMDRRTKDFVYGALAAFVHLFVDVLMKILVRGALDVKQELLELTVVFAGTVIFFLGMRVIYEDYASVAADGKNAISVFLTFLVVLYGLPLDVYDVSVALTVSIIWMLFSTWQFGFGTGTAFGVGAILVMAERTRDESIVSALLVLMLLVECIWEIVKTNKLLSAILFLLVYAFLGKNFYGVLYEEEMVKAIASATFVFAFLPNNLLYRVDKKVVSGEIATESAEWGRLVVERVNMLANAFKRIDYIFAGHSSIGVGFNEVGDILLDYTNVYTNATPIKKTTENAIINELLSKGIMTKNIIMTKNSQGLYQIYITVRSIRGNLPTTNILRQVVQNNISFAIGLAKDSRYIIGKRYSTFIFEQLPMYQCEVGVKKASKFEGDISGDNYYFGEISSGQYIVLLSDGMGNGKSAANISEIIVDALEELLVVGIDKDTSIKLVNNYLAKLTEGEQFSTLDMFVLDLHTGFGQFYKAGSATSFVKRGKWIETFESTSLPMGVVSGGICEGARRKFYDNDVIVMLSDGALEGISFEDKKQYVRDIILDFDDETVSDMANILSDRLFSKKHGKHSDDATLLVCKVVKTL